MAEENPHLKNYRVMRHENWAGDVRFHVQTGDPEGGWDSIGESFLTLEEALDYKKFLAGAQTKSVEEVG